MWSVARILLFRRGQFSISILLDLAMRCLFRIKTRNGGIYESLLIALLPTTRDILQAPRTLSASDRVMQSSEEHAS